MAFFKQILSGVAAIFSAEFAVQLLPGGAFRGISETRPTGWGLFWLMFPTLFWLLAVLFFGLFLAVSRLGNKPLRIFLFWIPTLSVSTLGVGYLALLTYLVTHVKLPSR
jgi:hypothetical protein